MATDQNTLNFYQRGPQEATPLLGLHGITAHGRRFDDLCREWLPGHNVVAPDLRGHGQSFCEAPWNLETHVDDIVAVLDHLGWDQVDVMGHSLGGNLALRLLATHPERVQRLVLLDPAFQLSPATMTANATAALADVAFPSQDDLVIAKRALRSEVAIPFADADTRLASIQGEDGLWRIGYDRCAVVAMWGELARALPPITEQKPTLLVNAIQAKFVLEPQLTYLESQLGNKLTRIDVDAGHMLYWDDLATTGQIVADFLADSGASTNPANS